MADYRRITAAFQKQEMLFLCVGTEDFGMAESLGRHGKENAVFRCFSMYNKYFYVEENYIEENIIDRMIKEKPEG